MKKLLKPLALVAAAFVLAGCGGGGGGSSAGISVTVSPESATLAPNASRTFTVMVIGNANTAVDWVVEEGSSGGSVTSAGVYTAPSISNSAVFHVWAISKADPNSRTYATVYVQPTGSGTLLDIDPDTQNLTPGQLFPFTANLPVTWSLVSPAGDGVINSVTGMYKAPSVDGTYKVRATTKNLPTQTADAIVNVEDVDAPPPPPGL